MSTIWLNVELSPGSDIENAAKDCIELASKLECTVWATFNGVKLCARQGDSPDLLVKSYFLELKNGSQYKIAAAYRASDTKESAATYSQQLKNAIALVRQYAKVHLLKEDQALFDCQCRIIEQHAII